MTVDEAAAREVATLDRTDDELQEAFAARSQVALTAARQVVDNVMATEKVTRFEVIDHTTEGAGRLLVRYGVKVEAAFQDQGRTMKVFLTDPPDPDQARRTVVDGIKAGLADAAAGRVRPAEEVFAELGIDRDEPDL